MEGAAALRVQDSGEDNGAVYDLPAGGGRDGAPGGGRGGQPEETRPELLVIDDECDIADLVGEIGEGIGLRSRAVYSPEDFLGALHPSLQIAVLDLNMPEIDGVGLIRHLAETGCQASLILMSGCSDSILNAAMRLAEARGLTVLGTVSKPFPIDAIEDLLRQGGTRAATPQARPAAGYTLSEVLAALDSGEIGPHYQPKIEIATGRVIGAEALARWHHPVDGVQGPGAFLDQIRAADALGRLTMRMLDLVLDDLACWQNYLPTLCIAVNAEPISLTDPAFSDQLAARLDDRGLAPDRLILEVTETEVATGLLDCIETVLRLRMKGICLAIDDFGTGHSSLAQLRRMPFDQLKIDRSFVSRITESPDCAVIVQSNIELAHRLGLSAVAEGVETVEQLSALEEWGCDAYQGFLAARAMPADGFLKWRREWTESLGKRTAG